MAFEIIKQDIFRISAKVSCGCIISQEYGDRSYKIVISDKPRTFLSCGEHTKEPKMIEFLLGEYLDTAIAEIQKSPVRTPSVDGESRVVKTGDIKPHHRRPSLAPAATKPTAPVIPNQATNGNVVDAMLAMEDTVEEADPLAEGSEE